MYKVHLPIMLVRASGSIERKKDVLICSCSFSKLMSLSLEEIFITILITNLTMHTRDFILPFSNFEGYPFKNTFVFTTAGDWDCVAAVERLPALHYSVDFIFLSFGIMGFISEL